MACNTGAPSKMSRDRIEFRIPWRRLADYKGHADVLLKSFGIDPTMVNNCIRHGQDLEIKCRPSQFARYIVLRCNAGIPNGIKELEASLVMEQEPVKYRVNASNKQNCMRPSDYPSTPTDY